MSSSNLIAGTTSGIYISKNNGTSWTSSGLSNTDIRTIVISSNSILAGTFNNGIFLSTDSGTSWTSINNGLSDSASSPVWDLCVSGTYIFAATDSGIFRSSDNGTNWIPTNTGLTQIDGQTFTISGNNIFFGSFGGGVFLSNNNGASWIQANIGLTDLYIRSLAVSGSYLYAGTYYSGVWKRQLSEMITAVKEIKEEIPATFSLSQNFPNPFNPSTSISFTLPSKSFVSLKVFDLIGREVATIVSEEISAGSYSRQWNASALSSGIYFYCLQAGSFTETKKLVLLK